METKCQNNSIFKIKISYNLRIFIFTILLLMVNLILKSQIVSTNYPNGGFEIDGNLKSNTPTMGVGDWLNNPGTGGYIIDNNGNPLNPNYTLLIRDNYNGNDNIFQSSKFNDDPNTWIWVIGSSSNKNDINNTLFHLATDNNNNTWLIVASDRLSNNGTSYLDFEFFQNTITLNQNGTFTSNGPHSGRTENDFVISMEYSNGGSNGIVRFYTWKLVNSTYKYVQINVPSNIAFAKTNLNTIPVDFGAFGSNQYLPYQFVEAAINITALFGTYDPCLGLNIKTILVKTKASTSQTASLGDLVNPIQTQLNLNLASISYPNNLCNNGTVFPTINGVQGGTFSASSNNLIINPTTGEIDLSNSQPGNYTITYTYSTNNCTKTTTTNITINQIPTPPTSICSSVDSICSNYNQTITLTAIGGYGTTLAWYSDSCGGTLLGTGYSISILPPTSTTNYYARWENSCGNSSCLSLTINVHDNLTASYNINQQISCYNGNDGQITITAQGGTGAYSYSLNGGAAQSSNTFSGLTAGTYSVVVTDANGCSNQIFVNLNNPEPLNITYRTYCKTGQVGIEILANGGNGVYLYSINGGSTFSSQNIYENLPLNDTLLLIVTDGNNCMSATYEVPVVSLNTLSASISILNQNLCFNSNDASVAINTQGGVPPYSYYLNNQPLISNIASQLSAGNYQVYIHDSNGCPFYTSFEIIPAEPISVEILNMINPDCYSNSYGQAKISVQGGTPPYQITWSSGESGFESNLLTPGINQIWVKDINGCEVEKLLNVQKNTVVVLPKINNVFTPNGDGINETWKIDHIEQFKENELFIYNRWGNEVYTTKNYSNNWNGSDLNEGTYFYILKLKVCDEWQEYSGYITILR